MYSPVSTVVSFALLAFVVGGAFAYTSTWPWLGVHGNDITPGIAEQLRLKQPYGLLVVTVDSGSPAEKAGIKGVERTVENGDQVLIIGDIIIGADGKEVKSSGDFYAFLATKHIGDNIKLTVIRDNSPQEINVVLAKKPV